jgi:hypothetical protein
MRHSEEESIAQLSESRRSDESRKLFWYDGIISTVSDKGAQAELYHFPLEEEVGLGDIGKIQQAFENRRKSGAADKSRNLAGLPSRSDLRQGMLIALQRMLGNISESFKKNPGNTDWTKRLSRQSFAYNATPCEMILTELRYHESFQLIAAASASAGLSLANPIRDVAEVDLQITSPNKSGKESFTIWFPLAGPMESIPIQIEYKPRWWLQVQLQLMEMEETAIAGEAEARK